MLKKPFLNTVKSIRFRQWSRKNYAVFAGLNKVISIGRVKASICDMALLKTNSLLVTSTVFSDNLLKNCDEEDEAEILLFENLLQTDLQFFAVDVPVCGLIQNYFRNIKLEWRLNALSQLF